jgi:hypothetical protein
LSNIFTITINETPYKEYLETLEKLSLFLIDEVDAELTTNQNKASVLIEHYSEIVKNLTETLEWSQRTDQKIKWNTIIKVDLQNEFPHSYEYSKVLPSEINNIEYSEINKASRQQIGQIYKILYSLEFELGKLSLKVIKSTSGRKRNIIPEKYFTWKGTPLKLDNLYHDLRNEDIIDCNKKMFLKAFSGEEFDSQLSIKWKFEGSKNRKIVSYTSLFHFIALLQKKDYIVPILTINKNLKSHNTKCYNLIHHVFINSDGSRINNLRQSRFEYTNLRSKDHLTRLDRLIK